MGRKKVRILLSLETECAAFHSDALFAETKPKVKRCASASRVILGRENMSVVDKMIN